MTQRDGVPKWWFIALVLVVLVIYGIPGFRSLFYHSEPRVVTPRGDLADSEKTTISIFKETSPAVVFITHVESVFDFRTFDYTQRLGGSGTGFFWDRLGHIVTNFHVVAGESEGYLVYLNDNRKFQARLVGISPAHDLAVLKIDITNDIPNLIPLGSSDDLEVGQSVFAIGNPYGFDYTLTTGIVSALERSIEQENYILQDLIQIDAAINQGNSGGPLLDSAGRLIGVNTAIIKGSVGIGFSVPVDTLNRVIPDLINYGRYRHPSIGIVYNFNINRQLNELRNFPGVIVMDVIPGSGAAEAGILGVAQRNGQLGDVIVGIDNTRIDTIKDLLTILNSGKLGNSIKLKVLRDNKVKTFHVKLTTKN